MPGLGPRLSRETRLHRGVHHHLRGDAEGLCRGPGELRLRKPGPAPAARKGPRGAAATGSRWARPCAPGPPGKTHSASLHLPGARAGTGGNPRAGLSAQAISPSGWGVGTGTRVGVSACPCAQAQWECVNAKYKQKKRHYRNSGVVILADLKVSAAPARSPAPEAPHGQMDPQGLGDAAEPQYVGEEAGGAEGGRDRRKTGAGAGHSGSLREEGPPCLPAAPQPQPQGPGGGCPGQALLTPLPGSSPGFTPSWTTSWAAARSTSR